MLKHVLLAGGMMIAGPVLAQTSSSTTQAQAGQAQPGRTTTPAVQGAPATSPVPTVSTAPTGDAITAQTSPATPAPTEPADPVTGTGTGTTEPASPSAAATPTPTPSPQADSAATTQSGGTTQVSQIVGREFGAYDKDKDGKLSQGEFDAWMVALKTASDPATKADSPTTKQWLGAAFAQADADKSRDVTQAELTGFLSQGQS